MRPKRMNTSPYLMGHSEGVGVERIGAVSQGPGYYYHQLALVRLCL